MLPFFEKNTFCSFSSMLSHIIFWGENSLNPIILSWEHFTKLKNLHTLSRYKIKHGFSVKNQSYLTYDWNKGFSYPHQSQKLLWKQQKTENYFLLKKTTHSPFKFVNHINTGIYFYFDGGEREIIYLECCLCESRGIPLTGFTRSWLLLLLFQE